MPLGDIPLAVKYIIITIITVQDARSTKYKILTGAATAMYVTYVAKRRIRKRNILLTVPPGFLRLLLYQDRV
jgi:hypothetical protein